MPYTEQVLGNERNMNINLLLKDYGTLAFKRGKQFHQLLSQLEQTETLNKEALIKYQNYHLRKIVTYAYETVPYYQNLFKQLNITPADIQTSQDLAILPLLTKEEIRGRELEFVSNKTKLKFKTNTSGTTGKPLKLYRDLFSINFENATLWRQKHWAKFEWKDKIATLRGQLVVESDRAQPPFWQYLPVQKKLVMSSYHLCDQFIPAYLEKLRSFQPAAIEGYPSSVYKLARYMEINRVDPLRVKAVFTSSEMLFDYQKEVITKYFGQVFDHYGNAERVAYFGMCEFGNYHYGMDYSIVEFLPTQRQGIEQIVGTTLHNFAMPLLRYVTGDLVQRSDQVCPCGRHFPVVKTIEGREDDYIITPSGKWIGRLSVVFRNIPNLVESQVIQEQLDYVRVLIVTTADFNHHDEEILKQKLWERLGSEIKIDLQKVQEIKRTKQGKSKLVVSNLQNN